jgi:putative flippase GtrA
MTIRLIVSESKRITVFAMVGFAATAVNFVILVLLVERFDVYPLLSFLLAYVVAFSVSYLGHYYLTFETNEEHMIAIRRFLFVSMFTSALNFIVFAVSFECLHLSYLIAFVITILIVPPFTYLLSRNLVFN